MSYGTRCTTCFAHLALPESRAFTACTGDDTAINRAACYLPDRIGHLYKCRPPPPSDIMQPGDQRLHWMPIAVDGTLRHEASYVHGTLGGTASPNQLSSCLVVGGSEKSETLYAASEEIDFDDELRVASCTTHNELQWGKLPWTHLGIDHIYFFAKKWRMLSKFSSFAMEGSHRRLKRMLRNNG